MNPQIQNLLRRKTFWLGAILFAAFVIFTVLASWLSPHSPVEQLDIVGQKLKAPGEGFILGSDHLSRDLLSRILYGGQISLLVCAVSVSIALFLGVGVGLVAGFWGGWLDVVLMRIVDSLLSFPWFVLLLVFLGVIPGEKTAIGIAVLLGLTGWMGMSRIVRARVISLKQADFILAATSVGNSPWKIIWTHILPNNVGIIAAFAALNGATAILAESSLSFLGIGVPLPTPSWGNLVAEGAQHLHDAPWLSMFPGLAILLTVLAVHLIGEAVEDSWDPKSL